jgi:RNA polymerase sigma-70 factor, ECF subfamily
MITVVKESAPETVGQVVNAKAAHVRMSAIPPSAEGDGRPDRGTAAARQTGKPEWELFEATLRRYHPELRAFAYKFLRDPEQTDDVLQDAYLRAFRAFPRFDPSTGTQVAWLYRIVYRCCVDEWRRNRRRRRLLHGRSSASTADFALTTVERLTFREALDRLQPDVRAAVILVHWRGLDYETAGAILGIPAGTVGSRLTKARALLRPAIESAEGEDETRR